MIDLSAFTGVKTKQNQPQISVRDNPFTGQIDVAKPSPQPKINVVGAFDSPKISVAKPKKQPKLNVITPRTLRKVSIGAFLQEVPSATKELGKDIGQSIARSFLATSKALITDDPKAEFVPRTKFEKKLAGTDKPVSFESIGREVAGIIGKEEKISSTLAVPLGMVFAGLDVTLFGSSKKSIQQSAKTIAKLDKVDDIVKVLKNVIKGGEDEIVSVAKSLVKVSDPIDVERVINVVKQTPITFEAKLAELNKRTDLTMRERALQKLELLKEKQVTEPSLSSKTAPTKPLEVKKVELPTNEAKSVIEPIKPTLNIETKRGNTNAIIKQLEKKATKSEIDNIILEDGTKLIDTVKVKRNPDKSLATVITKKEIDNIAKSYTDEIPDKWKKVSKISSAKETFKDVVKGIELPQVWFERKGLSRFYDDVIEAGRAAESQKTGFIDRFKDADLFKEGIFTKEGGWVTAPRFNLSSKEADNIGKYYLTRQDKGFTTTLESLTLKERKFVNVFDEIIKETEPRFFEVAKNVGKTPTPVTNYAPIMTKADVELADKAGAMDWLFRKHPSFFSLKERVPKVPVEFYETDYRKIASKWLGGITEFLNTGETTQNLKYLTDSDQFKSIVKTQDQEFIKNWLKDITTPNLPTTALGRSASVISRNLRKGVALGSLGLNYASVLKQALSQIPIAIINKSLPKFKSQYAKAFGIDVSRLPSITKRSGDIAISDLQGKVGRVFTGALTRFDRKNAQVALNGLLDKEYKKVLKEGAEITLDTQKLIEKKAQDAIDMWFGGFFKGQRPEAFRSEVGNFILMFTYPLTSQLNGFYRHILQAKGIAKPKAIAEVLAAATAIAYMEQSIEKLSFQWSDKKEMTKDITQSLLGNIPLVSQAAFSLMNDQPVAGSPVIGNINTLVRNINKAMDDGDWTKPLFTLAESAGLPKQIRRIKEGMEIIEEGGITDKTGKLLAPVRETDEFIRSVLRGKYGSIAAKDWIRNIGEKKENRKWFVPQVEFLQNGDYARKAEIYKTFSKQEKKEFRSYLSEGQQKKLNRAITEGVTTKSGGSSLNLSAFK